MIRIQENPLVELRGLKGLKETPDNKELKETLAVMDNLVLMALRS